jgi:gliding motility-associated-like protein
LPETSFTLSENGVCGPVNIAIDNTTVGSSLEYLWSIEPFGEQTVSEPGSLLFPAAPCDSIYYNISLIASNICGSVAATNALLVYSLPQPNFALNTDTICSEATLAIYNTTSCAWQTEYTWDLGDGSTSNSQQLQLENIYFTEEDFSTYTIALSASNACGTTEFAQSVVVAPNQITAFFNADPISGCEPLEVNFDQEMFGVTYFSWDFGNGLTSIEEDPTTIYADDGNFEVMFIAGNFCGAQDTAYQAITVLPLPSIGFTSSDQFLCVGESTLLTPFGDPISGHVWDFGDGSQSSLTSPTHIYFNEGSFEVTLTAQSTVNGCFNSVTEIIEVITTPTADITTAQSLGCPPFTVSFENNTTDAINYFWNLGDGNLFVGDSLSHTFQNSGTYVVEIIAINNNSCADTTNIEITVYPQPTAAFVLQTTDNDYFIDVDFENQSLNAMAYQWFFGDGGISYFTDPFHSYEKTGECIYNPTLIAFNLFGCTDTTFRTVDIPLEMRTWAPNAFTPDNDGVNDVFFVVTSDVNPLTSTLSIFNRWGVKIHESTGINPSWDGYVDGELAKNDVYIWKYFGREKCGQEEVSLSGHVTLVK